MHNTKKGCLHNTKKGLIMQTAYIIEKGNRMLGSEVCILMQRIQPTYAELGEGKIMLGSSYYIQSWVSGSSSYMQGWVSGSGSYM
jgi:hypothetical protein